MFITVSRSHSTVSRQGFLVVSLFTLQLFFHAVRTQCRELCNTLLEGDLGGLDTSTHTYASQTAS